jgi:hypothetical protein
MVFVDVCRAARGARFSFSLSMVRNEEVARIHLWVEVCDAVEYFGIFAMHFSFVYSPHRELFSLTVLSLAQKYRAR